MKQLYLIICSSGIDGYAYLTYSEYCETYEDIIKINTENLYEFFCSISNTLMDFGGNDAGLYIENIDFDNFLTFK